MRSLGHSISCTQESKALGNMRSRPGRAQYTATPAWGNANMADRIRARQQSDHSVSIRPMMPLHACKVTSLTLRPTRDHP